MNRREFIAGLGATAWPVMARAQQGPIPTVGYLSAGFEAPTMKSQRFTAFRQGLTQSGFVEGRTLAIEYRFGEGRNDQLPALAAHLVSRQVSVIVTTGIAATEAAKNATRTLPIVFVIAADPIAAGLVASLNRPGGNVTGVTNRTFELITKRIELIHQMVPTAITVGLLVNPRSPVITEVETKEAMTAVRALGLRLLVANASNEREIDSSFAYLDQQGVGALVVSADSLFANSQGQLVSLAAHHSMPTMYEFRDFADNGGLASYGANLVEEFRQVGAYTGRILKGERPAELPVQQSTKVELVINLGSAKALGLAIPETLLATADEVIQ